MGMSLSMGLAIGSFASALLGGDGQSGLSPPSQECTVDQVKPAVVRKRISMRPHKSGKKESAAVSQGLSSAAGPAANTPKRKGAAPDLDNLWVDWSPEKALDKLNPWPGVTYPPPNGAFADPNPDNWQPVALADPNNIRNMFAGASFVPGGNGPPFSYSGGGSFSSGGGSLGIESKGGGTVTAPAIAPSAPIPIPSSFLLLASGVLGIIRILRKF